MSQVIVTVGSDMSVTGGTVIATHHHSTFGTMGPPDRHRAAPCEQARASHRRGTIAREHRKGGTRCSHGRTLMGR